MHRQRNIHLVVWFAAAALVAAGCGSGPVAQSGSDSTGAAQVYAKFGGMQGKQRHDALVKAAKKEGSLVLYASNTDYKDLVTGFGKAYPSIDVQPYRASSEKVLQRILQEGSAGRTTNDVVDTNAGELDILASKKLLGDYRSGIRNSLRSIAKQDHWTATRINAFTVGWNTDQLPKGKRPTSYLDLAKPKWKGKISLEAGDSDWFGTFYTYLRDEKHMTQQQVDSYFRKLVSNAKVAKGHTVQGQLLSAGQFAVAMSLYKHTVDKDHFSKGAPVSWRPAVQPLFLRPNGQAVMKNAEHPAAALLYTDWVLTEGQKDIVQSYRVPVQKNVPGEESPVPADVKTYPIPDTVYSNSKKWSQKYDELLRGVPTVK